MKKKLIRLILWIITIQVIVSGVLIAYVSWDSNMKELSRDHSLKMSYIAEALDITQSNGTFINYHHFVQKMSALKNVRVTLYDATGYFLADSLNNTLLFQKEIEPEIKRVLSGETGDATRIDKFTKQLSYYTASHIYSNGHNYILVLSSSIEVLKSELMLLVRHITLAIIIGILIALSTGYRFINQYTEPIIRLKESANTIADGQYEYELDTSAKDEVGELTYAFGKMTDSVRSAVTELSESNAHMNAIIHEMFGGLIGIDLDDRVFLINPIAETLLELRHNKSVEKDYKELGLPPAILDSIDEVKYKQHETRHRMTLENGMVMIVQNAPIRKESGDLIGYVIVMFDITEKTQLAEMQRAFFTNVSHEIRTPLTSIQGFIETLENYRNLSDENMDAILKIMQVESQRLSGLLDTIMDIARFDTKQEAPEKRVFDLEAAVKSVVEDHKHLAQTRQMAIEISRENFETGSRGQVIQNREYVEIILSNLLSNAIKYGEAGSCIDLVVRSESAGIAISVSDKGPGIASEDLEKIFQRFYRCDLSRNSRTPGYGLGLYIAKTLSQASGMQLDVVSELGVGTSFTLRYIEHVQA